ncbi:hypothetical protein D3C72_1265930 [compost metagenome]
MGIATLPLALKHMETKYFLFTVITAFIMNLCTEANAEVAHYAFDLDRVVKKVSTEVAYNDIPDSEEDTREVKVVFRDAIKSRWPSKLRSGLTMDHLGGMSTNGSIEFAF